MSYQPSDMTYDLILQCLREEEPGIKIARLASFSPIDWEAVLAQAQHFGLAPLLAWQLKPLAPEVSPPEAIRQELRLSLLIGIAHNLRLFHELGKVLHQLSQADIPVILLKGAHLASNVYPDIGLRQMGDIDLLVRPEHLSACSQVLSGLDYCSEAGPSGMGEAQSDLHNLPKFIKPGATTIEVHWSIVDPADHFRVDLDELWHGARQIRLDHATALALSPPDLFLHLCIHAYQHRFFLGMRPYLDLIQVMNHYQDAIDWEQVRRKAYQWKASRCVFIALYLTRQILAAPPEQFLEMFTPPDFDPELAHTLLEKIFHPQQSSELAFGGAPISANFVKLWGTLSLGEKIAILWRRVFLPPQHIAQVYQISPRSLSLYRFYLLRIKSLLLRYWQPTWSNLTRGNPLASASSQEVALTEWISSG